MSKKLIITLIVILVLGIGVGYYLFRFSPPKSEEVFFEQELLLEKEASLEGVDQTFSARSEKFFIGGGKNFPVFAKELIVDPFKVKEGEEQYFLIWAKDLEGIEKVTATIKTDKGDEVFELELVEGTRMEGKWVGSWITKNISFETAYATEFRAINEKGKDTKLTAFWRHEE